jgi:hypothetical protein
MDAHVDRRPNLRDVNDVVEIQRARRLESGDGSPPVFPLLTRFAVVVPAAESDGIGVDVGGVAEGSRAWQPASVIRHIGEQIEQDVRRRRDAGRIELVPLRGRHSESLHPSRCHLASVDTVRAPRVTLQVGSPSSCAEDHEAVIYPVGV